MEIQNGNAKYAYFHKVECNNLPQRKYFIHLSASPFMPASLSQSAHDSARGTLSANDKM